MPDYTGEGADVINLNPVVQGFRDDRAQQERTQLREDEIRSQKAARRLQLINHVESSANPANYLVGDATVDAHTTEQLNSAKADIYNMFKQNPDADPVDIMSKVNNSVGPIAAEYAKRKAILQGVDQSVQQIQRRMPGINADALKMEARKQALLKLDDKGNPTYQSYNELNGNQNYAESVLNNSPEKFVDNAGLIKHFENPKNKQTITIQKGQLYNGVIAKNPFKATITDNRELNYTPDGTVDGLRYKADQDVLPDGTVHEGVPESTYRSVMENEPSRLSWLSVWNQMKKDTPAASLPNDSPVSQKWQQKYMLDWMKNNNAEPSASFSALQDPMDVYKEKADVRTAHSQRLISTRDKVHKENFTHESGVRQNNAKEMESIKQGDRIVTKQTPGAKSEKSPEKVKVPWAK